MSGRPVRLLTAAAVAVAASLFSVSAASAGCYTGCGYAAPVVRYVAPVVYSYTYTKPVTYASPCSPCGYAHVRHVRHRHYYPAPMYIVNQGPTYTAPVIGAAEGVVEYGYRRSYPFVGGGRVHWHRKHWHHRWGHRHGMRHHHHGWRHHRMGGPRVLYAPRARVGVLPPRQWNSAVRPNRPAAKPMMEPGSVDPRRNGNGNGAKKQP